MVVRNLSFDVVASSMSMTYGFLPWSLNSGISASLLSMCFDQYGGSRGHARGSGSAEALPEELEREGLHVGPLGVGGSTAVPPLDVLDVRHVLSRLPHLAAIFRAWPGCTRSSGWRW